MAQRGIRDLLRLFRATCARSFASSATFMRMDAATSSTTPAVSCFSWPRNGYRNAAIAHVVPQFAMLEEDVHRFPQRVIQDLDHLLVQNGSCGRRLQAQYEPSRPGQREGHRAAALRAMRAPLAPRRSPSGGPKPITMSSGCDDRFEPRAETASKDRAPAARACRRSPDARTPPRHAAHRWHRAASESQQAAAREKAVRHLAAGQRQPRALRARRNSSKSSIALEKRCLRRGSPEQ